MANTNNSISFLSAKDALTIPNIQSGNLTIEDIKTVYEKAVAKNHPVRNSDVFETTKTTNVDFEILKAQDLNKINLFLEGY